MYKYWQAECGEREMPARSDIDPAEMPKRFLPRICIGDVVADGRRYVYRLVGTGDVEVRRNDPTGKSILEVSFGPSAADALSCYDRVVKSKAPFLDAAPFTAERQIRERRNTLFAVVRR